MRRFKKIAVSSMAVLAISACASEKPKLASINANPSPYAQGQSHTEPLFYNGRTYQVQFKHIVAQRVYSVNVSARGRSLGKTAADARIVSEVGRNAINHFACKDNQKAKILDGSVEPSTVGWNMRARCA
ncbi:hypothetical protein [Anderseniella sp. Alg231-50]|uniref:hypothetical protein n=1 Tax=Anderseniella sp. Alg231-50 TaxID=1922226 RepID=UPI000D55BC2C